MRVQGGEDGGLGVTQPTETVGGNRARFDLSNCPAPFGIGNPRTRAGSGRGKPITGEHEQRPPHRQMFDQRPVGIWRAIEMRSG